VKAKQEDSGSDEPLVRCESSLSMSALGVSTTCAASSKLILRSTGFILDVNLKPGAGSGDFSSSKLDTDEPPSTGVSTSFGMTRLAGGVHWEDCIWRVLLVAPNNSYTEVTFV